MLAYLAQSLELPQYVPEKQATLEAYLGFNNIHCSSSNCDILQMQASHDTFPTFVLNKKIQS